MKRTQMTISFGEYDDDVYNFLQGQKNASALIRKLVRDYMNGSSAPLPAQEYQVANRKVDTIKPEITNEKNEDNSFDYSKCGNDEVVVTRTEDKNRKKIQELDL